MVNKLAITNLLSNWANGLIIVLLNSQPSLSPDFIYKASSVIVQDSGCRPVRVRRCRTHFPYKVKLGIMADNRDPVNR